MDKAKEFSFTTRIYVLAFNRFVIGARQRAIIHEKKNGEQIYGINPYSFFFFFLSLSFIPKEQRLTKCLFHVIYMLYDHFCVPA